MRPAAVSTTAAVLFACVLARQGFASAVGGAQIQVASAVADLRAARAAVAGRAADDPAVRAAFAAADAAAAAVDRAGTRGNLGDLIDAATAKMNARTAAADLLRHRQEDDPAIRAAEAAAADAARLLADAMADAARRARAAADQRRLAYVAAVSQPRFTQPSDLPVRRVGDEASLTVVRANAEAYVDQPFVVTGVVRSCPAEEGDPVHYGFTFQSAAGNGTFGPPTPLAQDKRSGGDLLLATANESEYDPQGVVPARLLLRLVPACPDRHGHGGFAYEIVDWQVRDAAGGWSPWGRENVAWP